MRFPDFIKQEDCIGFVAPAFGCATEPYHTAFKNALKKMEQLGFSYRLGKNVYLDEGIGISNTPVLCANELQSMYQDSEIKCLISCGGGELMCEIVPHLDFTLLRNATPKWFLGYSDNTNFSFLLCTLADTAAIYGPCAAAFGMEPWHPAIQDAWDLLCGSKTTMTNYEKWEMESKKDEDHPLEPYHVTEQFAMKTWGIQDGETISGRLIGGCLDCLSNLVGTSYDHVVDFQEKYKDEGIIWFLEACDLNVFSIRRSLWNLREAGWFRYVKGFLIGRPMHYNEPMMGLDQYQAVLGILQEFDVPVVMDLDIGHTAPMMPLVLGSYATVQIHQRGEFPFEIKMEMK